MLLKKLVNWTKLKPLLWMQSLTTRRSSVRIGTNYEMSLKKRQRMMARDKVVDSYTPIYNAPSGLYFRAGYPSILIFAIFGPSYYFYKFELGGHETTKTVEIGKLKVTDTKRDFYILIAGSILCVGAFLGVLFKYPYRVYKHKDKLEYIAIYQSVIPLRIYQFYFTKGSEAKFANPLYFFVKDGQFLLEKKKAILMPFHFRTSYDLCQMLGVK